MSALASPAAGGRHRGLIPAVILFAATLTYMVAVRTDRWHYEYSLWLLVLLAPVLWLCLTPLSDRLRGRAAGFALLGLLGIGYMGLLQLADPATVRVDWGRWTVRCAVLSAAICVLACRPPAREFLAVLGASSACALIVGAVVNIQLPFSWWLLGDMPWFGLGNVNYLVNTAGPPLLAWAVLLGAELVRDRRLRWSEGLWCLLGLAALAWYAHTFSRRGVQLAALCVAAWPLWLWCYRRWPRLALGAAGVVTVVVVIKAIEIFSITGIPSSGLHRVALYKAMAVLGIDGLPWGWGHYGAMHLAESDHPIARSYIASGHWANHAHNVFLDALVDGGVILLAVVVGQCLLCLRHLCRITDPALHLGLGALAIATFVHMGTSIAYGIQVGDAVWHLSAAAILIAPTRDPPGALRLPPARWLQWPLVVAAVAIGALPLMRAATMHEDASLAVKWDAIRQLRSPSNVRRLYMQMEDELRESGPVRYGDRWIDLAEVRDEGRRTLGTVGHWPLIDLRVAAQQRQALIEGREFVPSLLLRERERQLAEAYVRYLHRWPFDAGILERLHRDAQSQGFLAELVPTRLLRRAAYLNGVAGLPAPDLNRRLHDVEGNADLLAELRWALANGLPMADAAPVLHHLFRHHGGVGTVARTVLMAAAMEGIDPHLSWLLAEEFPRLARHASSPEVIEAALGLIDRPTRARAFQPLLERLYPGFYRRLRAGEPPMLLGASDPREQAANRLALQLLRVDELAADD